MKPHPRAESSRDDKARTGNEAQTGPEPVGGAGEGTPPDDTSKQAEAPGSTGGVTVRPEAVAKARALLQSGQLGSDPEKLADHIIDALLKSRDTRT
jgi:anti-sigma28 factor (negative regulator of flagellin synthesis)